LAVFFAFNANYWNLSACHTQDSPKQGEPVSVASAQSSASWAQKVRPEIARLATNLALADQVESERIGEGGDSSTVFATFSKLKAEANASELRALAQHDSPVVRVYVGWELLRVDPTAAELAVLKKDNAKVKTQRGCKGSEQTVASAIANGS
jgi:hypothetical protein